MPPLMIEFAAGIRGRDRCALALARPRDEFRIRGTEGEIDLTPLNGPELVYPGGVESIPAPANLHFPCMEDFAHAVERDILPRSYAQSALATEWVMDQVANGRK